MQVWYNWGMSDEPKTVKVRVIFDGKVVELEVPGPLSVWPAKSGKRGAK